MGETQNKELAMKNILVKAALVAVFGATGTISAWKAADTGNPGMVKALMVQGNVRIEQPDGVVTPLQRGASFAQGSTVLTDGGSAALLIFSNGAAVRVAPRSEVAVKEFVQASFDTKSDGTFLRLHQDPSRSNVVLELRQGALAAATKRLNQQAGSTFVVETPMGNLNVRNALNVATRATAG
jgi:hypothetical protein